MAIQYKETGKYVLVPNWVYDASLPWTEERIRLMSKIKRVDLIGGRTYQPADDTDLALIRDTFKQPR